jgi:SAM-dependent methyltransferase
MTFQDHFSEQAQAYARHRPTYPADMFAYLASLAPSRQLAWDCGTGNGQAAIALAEHFQHIIATDASASQIENAFPHDRVEYRVEPSEQTSLPNGAFDLVTVGTAVHWFDFGLFYAEVRRVAKANGILAVWTYSFPDIIPTVEQWIENFYYVTLKGFWPERIRFLEQRYETLPFPFEEIRPPAFQMEADWTLDSLVGFLSSWSAVRRFVDVQGEAAFEAQVEELATAWGEATQTMKIRWPLHFRIGRISK